MLFFFITTSNNRSSTNYVVPFLLFFLFICNTFLSVTNASLSFNNHEYDQNRRWIISNKNLINTDNDRLERTERGTGFFVYRKGEYLLFIPDRRHHFTKNIRPYIGRRR
jgi:hypothetical protein